MKDQLILALVAAFGFASCPLAIAEFAESNISSDQVETNVGLFFSKISAPSNLRSQTYNDTTNPSVADAPETSSTVLTFDGVDVNTTVASIEGVEVTNTVSSVDGVPVSTTVVSLDGVPVSTTVISVSDDPMSSAKVNLDEASFERAANDDARDIDPAESLRSGNFSLSVPLNDSLSSQPVIEDNAQPSIKPKSEPKMAEKGMKKAKGFLAPKNAFPGNFLNTTVEFPGNSLNTTVEFPGNSLNTTAQATMGKGTLKTLAKKGMKKAKEFLAPKNAFPGNFLNTTVEFPGNSLNTTVEFPGNSLNTTAGATVGKGTIKTLAKKGMKKAKGFLAPKNASPGNSLNITVEFPGNSLNTTAQATVGKGTIKTLAKKGMKKPKHMGKDTMLANLNAYNDGTTTETANTYYYYNLAETSSPSLSPSSFTSTIYDGTTSGTGYYNLAETPSPSASTTYDGTASETANTYYYNNLAGTPSPSASTTVDAYYYYYYPTVSGTTPA